MRSLITNNEELLRRPCTPATLKEGRHIADDLINFLESRNRQIKRAGSGILGVGLAAPQLGIYKRVCVTYAPRALVFINPRVIQASNGLMKVKEGCLSFPGIELETYRHEWVEVETDNWKYPLRFGQGGEPSRTDRLKAICAQHEIAHVYSLLFSDFTTIAPPHPTLWENHT